MVLSCDIDFAREVVHHRHVNAAVAELEFVGFHAECSAEDLVAEADAEERNFCCEHFTNDLYHGVGGCGVTRAIRDEDAVRVVFLDLVKGGIGRNNNGADTASSKISRRVGLNPHIESNHGVSCFPLWFDDVGVVSRHIASEVGALHRGLGAHDLK